MDFTVLILGILFGLLFMLLVLLCIKACLEKSRLEEEKQQFVVSSPAPKIVVHNATLDDQTSSSIGGDSVGELMLDLCYTPELKRLKVVVVRARNLIPGMYGGSVDPFVKLWLIQGDNRIVSKKTTAKEQTLSPVFNEVFVFKTPTLKEVLEKEVKLIAMVCDKSAAVEVDEIGSVVMGANCGTDLGKKHWYEVLDEPNQAATAWHPLRPLGWNPG